MVIVATPAVPSARIVKSSTPAVRAMLWSDLPQTFPSHTSPGPETVAVKESSATPASPFVF